MGGSDGDNEPPEIRVEAWEAELCKGGGGSWAGVGKVESGCCRSAFAVGPPCICCLVRMLDRSSVPSMSSRKPSPMPADKLCVAARGAGTAAAAAVAAAEAAAAAR